MSKKIVSYPGREITTEEVRKGKVLESIQRVEPRYNWAAGVAISRFLVELKNGKIIGRKCSQCQRILVPPRMYCEQCYRPTDEWVEVNDTGTINTYSVSHVAADASRLKEPLVVAGGDIDGATPGMGILHLPQESQAGPGKIHIRIKIKTGLKPK